MAASTITPTLRLAMWHAWRSQGGSDFNRSVQSPSRSLKTALWDVPRISRQFSSSTWAWLSFPPSFFWKRKKKACAPSFFSSQSLPGIVEDMCYESRRSEGLGVFSSFLEHALDFRMVLDFEKISKACSIKLSEYGGTGAHGCPARGCVFAGVGNNWVPYVPG
jgi:hypothetical protein